MQLFSIGLYELNRDGTLKLVGGQPVETYDSDDIVGCRAYSRGSAGGPGQVRHPFQRRRHTGSGREVLFMQSIRASTRFSEKRFLTAVIRERDRRSRRRSAHDARHDREPSERRPIISRQLIQRW